MRHRITPTRRQRIATRVDALIHHAGILASTLPQRLIREFGLTSDEARLFAVAVLSRAGKGRARENGGNRK